MGGKSSKPAKASPPAAAASKITAADKATLELKVQRDKLKQYQKKIQVVLEKELEIAKTHMANGDKKKALLALKKKKYQQNLLAQTEGQLFNLEQLTMTIENAAVEAEVIKGLELGNQVLKEINKEMDLDKVEKLMADTEDAIAYQNEIEEMLSRKLTSEDDSAIRDELDALVKAEMEEKLPSVPTAEVPQVEEQEVEKEPTKEELEATERRRREKGKGKATEDMLEEPMPA